MTCRALWRKPDFPTRPRSHWGRGRCLRASLGDGAGRNLVPNSETDRVRPQRAFLGQDVLRGSFGIGLMPGLARLAKRQLDNDGCLRRAALMPFVFFIDMISTRRSHPKPPHLWRFALAGPLGQASFSASLLVGPFLRWEAVPAGAPSGGRHGRCSGLRLVNRNLPLI